MVSIRFGLTDAQKKFTAESLARVRGTTVEQELAIIDATLAKVSNPIATSPAQKAQTAAQLAALLGQDTATPEPGDKAQALLEAPILKEGKRIDFFNGDLVGPSPALAKKSIQYVGTVKSAILYVELAGKLGWELKEVRFNGKAIKHDPSVKNTITAHVEDAIISGDNTLEVHYDAPFTAHFGDRTTLTGYLQVATEIAPGLGGLTTDFISLDLISEDIDKRLANAAMPTFIILGLIAAIIIAIAVIIFKVSGFMGAVKP